MLNVKAYVRNALITSAPLTTALGSANKIVYMYPNDFVSLPVVTYSETNQHNTDFSDNVAYASWSEITIDVWTKDVSTTTIAALVDNVMIGLLFTLDYSSDVPDPDAKIFHRALRYSRKFTADDLDAI